MLVLRLRICTDVPSGINHGWEIAREPPSFPARDIGTPHPESPGDVHGELLVRFTQGIFGNQWIGLRENLQETIDFSIKYGAFL